MSMFGLWGLSPSDLLVVSIVLGFGRCGLGYRKARDVTGGIEFKWVVDVNQWSMILTTLQQAPLPEYSL